MEEYLKKYSNSKIIKNKFKKNEIVKKINAVQDKIKDIETKISNILSDKKSEELVVGALLLAGELRFAQKGTKLHKSIIMLDDDYSQLSKKIKKIILKKIEKSN